MFFKERDLFFALTLDISFPGFYLLQPNLIVHPQLDFSKRQVAEFAHGIDPKLDICLGHDPRADAKSQKPTAAAVNFSRH